MIDKIEKLAKELRLIWHEGDNPRLPSVFKNDWNKMAKHILILEIKVRLEERLKATNDVNSEVQAIRGLQSKLKQLEETEV